MLPTIYVFLLNNLGHDSLAIVEKCRHIFMLDLIKNDMIFRKCYFTDLYVAIINLKQSNLAIVQYCTSYLLQTYQYAREKRVKL